MAKIKRSVIYNSKRGLELMREDGVKSNGGVLHGIERLTHASKQKERTGEATDE